MAVGLMDIKGQYAELQDSIEEAVLEVLRSGRVILGPNVKGFEDEAAAYMGTAGAVGVANGTDGLTIALRALGVGAGDEVITVPFTFYATPEAIAQAGAKPVFVDILPDTPEHGPGRHRGRHHAAHQGDHAGRPLRPALRHRRHPQGRGGARSARHRGRLPGLGRELLRPQGRQPRRPRRVQLLPHQEPRRLRRRRPGHRPRRRRRPARARAALPRQQGQEDLHRHRVQLAARRSAGRDPPPRARRDRRVERPPRAGGRVVRRVPAGRDRAPRRPRRPHARLPPVHDPAPQARRHRRRVQGAPGGLRRVLHHADAVAAGVRRHGSQARRLPQHRRGGGRQPRHPDAPQPHRGAGAGSRGRGRAG